MTIHKEIAFEEFIENHLLQHGWVQGRAQDFNPTFGLDLAQLFGFLEATQAQQWAMLVANQGGDAALARSDFLKRLTSQLDNRGVSEVLRKGVTDRGVAFQLAYFRPAHHITPDVEALYAQNRVCVTRQLAYSKDAHLTLDLMFSVNGIPVATAELKNHLTHQDVNDAVEQYRKRRDPADPLFARRTIVHFAVDSDEARITTRLAGPATEFVPFNRGDANGKGNPPNPDGYRTEYLWKDVWQRDHWLDLLGRFVQVTEVVDPKTKHRDRRVIFPRYHQWDAVRQVLTDVSAKGNGQRYLIEHSAGSGKSNTIAWTAHRLSTLHDAEDRKVFDKVIVVTDRVNLDQQLQDTVKQFEQTAGVVSRIDKDANQLAKALVNPGAQIVITTLQKFLVLLEKGTELKDGGYAILIDEAHSSQAGESARALKVVLGAGSDDAAVGKALAAAEAEDAKDEAAHDPEDAIARAVAARGIQKNLTYVAFTATPKQRTLELFGTKAPDGQLRPFHLYAMRQAIQEGFIIDVLANYVTYATYYKVGKAFEDKDPLVERAKAGAAIAQHVSLHPAMFAQKAEIIVEQVRRDTVKKMDGRAKAMVVTRSRLHAVRQKQAIDRYISQKGYDLRACIAFSGTVEADGLKYTERDMNGFAERELPAKFAAREPDPDQPGRMREAFHMLVVAEKYQTGYDEPLLHTMFVDKRLDGLKAVQTLSRLNRMRAGKLDTFVLDFVNEADDIQKAFKPYYEETVAQPTDPNLLYNARDRIIDFGIIDDVEAAAFVTALLSARREDQPKLYGATDAARDRYLALSLDRQFEFRQALHAFIRLYSFLGQIVSFKDAGLERLYVYARFLLTRFPKEREAALDLGDIVQLTHLRIEMTGQHSLALPQGAGEVGGFKGQAHGREHDASRVPLSEIITLLNTRFGLQLGLADGLFFEQLFEEFAADPALLKEAGANTLDNFMFGFERAFENKVIERQGANKELFEKLMDDKEFSAVVQGVLAQRVYEKAHSPGA